MEFAPDLVIISAGFDAARGDDLGGCDVTPGGYAHMTHMLCSLASGKVVVALEGGYNLDSIRDSAVAVMRVLLGESPPPMPSMVANRKATETIYQALRVQSKYWKSIIAPVEEVEQTLEYVEAAHFPTILKEYRSRQLYLSHKLYQLPIVDDILKQAFDGLVLCSADIFRVTTLILFIHNFGDLHVELMGEASVDVNLEKSFIMDASGEMVGWARQNGYGFIDLNVFANNLKNLPRDAMKETVSLQRKIITYVWDNFVEIAEDASVYLVAYGGASFPISELFKARDVTKKLKGVAQIIGKSQTPAQVTRVTGADDWFVKNGVVYVGVDSKDEALFGPRAGIGRIEQLSTTALRGPVVMQRCIPRLDELVKSGRPFGHNLA
ncbi:Histone deacetylase hda1 [Serendipita sp. 407]|nr:Histone deacetylase hda1 [Serendipita sp. 407]